MSKLFKVNDLCAIQEEPLGVSRGSDNTSIICTISKKFVYLIKVGKKIFSR